MCSCVCVCMHTCLSIFFWCVSVHLFMCVCSYIPFNFLLVCTYACVHVCVCIHTWVHTRICMCGGQRSLWVSSVVTHNRSLRQGLLLKLIDLVRPTGQTPGVFLPPLSELWDYRCELPCLSFYIDIGCVHRSSCFLTFSWVSHFPHPLYFSKITLLFQTMLYLLLP